MIRFASEDIGLADPYALTLTMTARDSYHFLGSPEGELAIAQAVVNTALGVTSALTIPPPLGEILAGVVGAIGAVEIGIIASR